MKKILNKKFWLNMHLYLSMFFLPAAFIYAITGGLYIFDIKENSGAKITNIKLETPAPKGQEQEFILQVLKDNNLKIPKNTTLQTARNGMLMMGDKLYSVSLSKNNDGTNTLRAIDRNIYSILVLMHKAKNTPYFDVIAVGFFISMILFYLSGLVMTSFCKGKRKSTFFALGLGFALTAIATFYSI